MGIAKEDKKDKEKPVLVNSNRTLSLKTFHI